MPTESKSPDSKTVGIWTLATLAIIAALYFGRVFLVPIALAMMLNAVFRPIVRGMQRWKVPAPVTAILIVLGLIGVMVLGIASLQGPVQRWFEAFPQSIAAAQKKLEGIREPVRKVSAVADQLAQQSRDIATSQPTTQPDSGASPAASSRQEVEPRPPSLLGGVLGTTSAILGSITEVLVLLLLILSGGGSYQRKLAAVLRKPADKQTAERIVHQSHSVVLRYLLVTAIINVCQGVVVGITLHFLGISNPLLWGALTFVLEFVPYLGATVMILLLTAVAVASLDGLGHIFAVPASYMLINTLQNNIVSPYAYGHNLKLNPVAVLLGVLFWWFLWGIPGAFIAVPILAALKVITDNVDRFKPIGEFLGE